MIYKEQSLSNMETMYPKELLQVKFQVIPNLEINQRSSIMFKKQLNKMQTQLYRILSQKASTLNSKLLTCNSMDLILIYQISNNLQDLLNQIWIIFIEGVANLALALEV